MMVMTIGILLLCIFALGLDGFRHPCKTLFVSRPTVQSFELRTSALRLSSTDNEEKASGLQRTFDPLATANYILATGIQWALITFTLSLIQKHAIPFLASGLALYKLPSSFINIVPISLFLFLSLRSRVFSPLDNSRPSAMKDDPVFTKRKLPSFMPPRMVFPVVWSTITLLRTISSFLVFQKTESLVSAPLLALTLHLCVGDTWNTINNVESRLGTAALVVLAVLATCLVAVRRFYEVLPRAGLLLAPSAVWLGVANVLVHRIWAINNQKGQYSYWPSKEEGPVRKWQFLRTTSALNT